MLASVMWQRAAPDRVLQSQGFAPRAEVQEQPLALKRDTITIIDRAQPGEHPDTQHSNFKFYQNRATGDAVSYLTRHGEREYEQGRMLCADLYQYRVAIR